MRHKFAMKRFPLSLFVLLGFAAPAMANNIVQNGSLENLNATFSNTTCNYMTLGNGSTTIPGWTVSTSSGARPVMASPRLTAPISSISPAWAVHLPTARSISRSARSAE
jgi:hypothetical protein